MTLDEKEEFIADLRARVSHVEAERDQRHDAWAQSVKNEAALQKELRTEIAARDGLLADALREGARTVLDAVEAEHSPSDHAVDLYLHMDADETCETCEDGGHACTVCEGCWPSWEGMDGHSVYPCSTLRAARDAAAKFGATS